MLRAMFVPGYIATRDVYSPWLEKLAKKYGVDLYIHERPYSALLGQRSEQLRNEIMRLSSLYKEKVYCIGHSRGGTDLTYTLHKFPELRGYVGSVTTMASPHKGSLVADLVMSPGCNLKFNALKLAVDILNEEGTVKELTFEAMEELNIYLLQGVTYASYSFFAHKYKMADPGNIDLFGNTLSDGTVSLESQTLGQLQYRLEACHTSQTVPYPYGHPLIRFFSYPYKKVWKTVFKNLHTY